MARLLAVQWDQQRIRFAFADSGRQGKVSLSAAGVVSVEAGDGSLIERIGQTLKAIVTEHKAEKARVLIGISRGAVDVAELSLPMAEDAELPALVANMAQREIPGLADTAPVDFIAFPSRPDGMRPVTAMALHGEDGSQIAAVCVAAGISPGRIVVAPYSLAALIEPRETSSPTLLVSAGEGQAELLLLKNGQPIVARTLRLSDSTDARVQAEHINGEVRRTLLSLSGEPIETADLKRLVVFGDPERTTQFASELAVDFDVAAERVDPFSLVGGKRLDDAQNASGLAPLIGMLLEEARGIPAVVDFANPKKPAPPQSRRSQWLAVAALLLLLAGGGWYYAWSQFDEFEQDNARLAERLAELQELNEKASQKRRLDKALTLWEGSRVSWLDELRDLTLRMPPSRDVRVQQLSISPSSGNTYVATFGGVARDVGTVQLMETRLRDRWHQLRTPGVREQAGRRNSKNSSWTFQTTMTFTPRGPEQYVSHLSDEERAALIAAREAKIAESDRTQE